MQNYSDRHPEMWFVCVLTKLNNLFHVIFLDLLQTVSIMDILQLTGLIVLLVLILIVILFLQYYYQRWPVRNFPPGPTGLPIVGTTLTCGSDLHVGIMAWKLVKRYGNVCSIMIGKFRASKSTGARERRSQKKKIPWLRMAEKIE